jgi:NADPH:quinone reductase-like Zn-dependent oxidoreductase
MKQIFITQAGDVDVLEVREGEDPRAGDDDVVIDVAAVGINFADLLARMGTYPDAPPIPCVVGYEVSGTVREVGGNVTSIEAGQRVLAVTRFGGYSTVAVTPQTLVWPMPDNMSFEEGAAIPVNYITAYLALFTMGNLKKGERVLIHSAGGGVGIAATQLARTVTDEIFGTASAGKHAAIGEIGVRYPIDYRSQDFAEEIARITSGRGVHLIMDALGGKSVAAGKKILSPLGRIVVYGISSAVRGGRRSFFSILKTVMQMPKFGPLDLMDHNHGVWGLNVGHLWSEAGALRDAVAHVVRLYEEGTVRPVIARSFPFADVREAHTYIQERRNTGKVVLTT